MSTPATDSPSPREMAFIHFEMGQRSHSAALPVPQGERTVVDLLPAAGALADKLTRVALDLVEAAGKKASCRAACGACCRQLVAISVVEARGLADVLAKMPAQRQTTIRARFAAAVQRLEEAGLLNPAETKGQRALLARKASSAEEVLSDLGHRYFQLKIPCPFLEDESCSIYADRPMVCREYHVTSPAENCARLFQVAVDRVQVPVRLSEVLMRTAHDVTGTPLEKIPLTLSLEWCEANPDTLQERTDGKRLFQTMLSHLG